MNPDDLYELIEEIVLTQSFNPEKIEKKNPRKMNAELNSFMAIILEHREGI